jgi:peptidoglycan/LPS O-acetylase OafA/YrhL
MELQIMATTVFTVLALTVLCAAVVYLFVIEPRSKIHDL